MADYRLICGNKRYSSWSMRPWVAMKAAGIAFDEETIWLDTDTAREEKLRHSPAARVPILLHDGQSIWDSLAICEYLADRHPDAGLWPTDPKKRARARSLVCEMHSGFMSLREEMPLNTTRRQRLSRSPSESTKGDIARIEEIWGDAEGPFLFGEFSLADAFFAPVASRFVSYQAKVEAAAHGYMNRLLGTEAVSEWLRLADAEDKTLPDVDGL